MLIVACLKHPVECLGVEPKPFITEHQCPSLACALQVVSDLVDGCEESIRAGAISTYSVTLVRPVDA